MGSFDLYVFNGRLFYVSINFVIVYDGFILNDLVSYNEKYNEVNGEDNNDGEKYNCFWNFGEEGEINDLEILSLRNC